MGDLELLTADDLSALCPRCGHPLGRAHHSGSGACKDPPPGICRKCGHPVEQHSHSPTGGGDRCEACPPFVGCNRDRGDPQYQLLLTRQWQEASRQEVNHRIEREHRQRRSRVWAGMVLFATVIVGAFIARTARGDAADVIIAGSVILGVFLAYRISGGTLP